MEKWWLFIILSDESSRSNCSNCHDTFVWPWNVRSGHMSRYFYQYNASLDWFYFSTGCVLHGVNWRWTWVCSCLHMAMLLNFTRVFLDVRRVLHSVAVSHRWSALFPVRLFTPRVACLVYFWSFEGFPLVSHITFPVMALWDLCRVNRPYFVYFLCLVPPCFWT